MGVNFSRSGDLRTYARRPWRGDCRRPALKPLLMNTTCLSLKLCTHLSQLSPDRMDENKPETTELAMVDDIPGPDAKSTCLEATVDGTSRLFGDDGRLRLVPRPSSNSNGEHGPSRFALLRPVWCLTPACQDPLTLPTWRKLMATIALCYCRTSRPILTSRPWPPDE